MSLLDTASLIVTPNGYKEGKLYSVIPSDGSGDMSVTRATTATRVNSAGLVELVPYNLFEYSEQFDDAWWTKYESTVTANNTTAPNGTTTADKLTDTTANDGHFFYRVLTISSALTLSVYAKAAEYTKVAIRNLSDGGDVIFDLANGTIISTAGNFANAQIESIGNGWYRVSATTNGTSGTKAMGYGLVNNSNQTTFVGTGTSSAYFWGAQLVEGSTAKPYQKTETRLNIPRLDYSNGTCPSLLVEPQRTNSCLNSEDFSAASWINFQTSETVNNTTAPNGLNTADRMTQTGAGSGSIYNAAVTLSGASTASCYFKAGTSDFVAIDSNGTGGYWGAAFNLTTLAITYFGSGTNGKIEDVGNGWFRCSVSVNATGVNYLAFGIIGNISDYVYLWGAQLEAGSYATSYIPTTSASVTRNADVISKTGISSLIGQTEGTMFAQVSIPNGADASRAIAIQGGSDRVGITVDGTNVGFFIVDSSGVIYSNVSAITWQSTNKLALAYTSGNTTLYVNGSAVLSTTASFTFSGSIANVYLGQYEFAPGTGQNGQSQSAAALWQTRLTNDELATLTTI